jgi:hypothetical protein
VAEDTGKYNHEARMEAARNGEALPDGSYPTRDCAELGKAVEAYGRETGDKAELRRYLIRRSVKLGCTEKIPDEWEVD